MILVNLKCAETLFFSYGHYIVKLVKPVYKGHSMEPENVAFMSSCPLYAG